MKKIFLILSILIFVFSCTNAQMRKDYRWGCSLGINSIQAQVEVPLMTGPGALMVDADGNIIVGGNRIDNSSSFSIIPKYNLNDDILFRFEFGLTNLNLKANAEQKGPTEHVISNSEVSTKIFRYAAGFQWTFIKTRKLESYCGITASYINYKSLNYNLYGEHRNSKTDTLLYWVNDKETTPGGYALGIGPLVGFNMYINKRISFGAELSSSALYYEIGGITASQGSEQSLPTPTFSYTTTYMNSYNGFKISKIISSFNITVWF